VQARIVDSIELTRRVGERHGFARDLDLMDGTCWNFGSLGSAHKRHIRSFENEKKMNQKLGAQAVQELPFSDAEYNFHALPRQNRRLRQSLRVC
jgi:hypothetical protein